MPGGHKGLVGKVKCHMPGFNQLTHAQAERLAILSEELGEAQQRIGKILRHGYTSCHPSTQESNRTGLEKELGDVFATTLIMARKGDIDKDMVNTYRVERELRHDHGLAYTHHQNGRPGDD